MGERPLPLKLLLVPVLVGLLCGYMLRAVSPRGRRRWRHAVAVRAALPDTLAPVTGSPTAASPPPVPARQRSWAEPPAAAPVPERQRGWVGSAESPLLLFVAVTSVSAAHRSALRRTWLAAEQRPYDFDPLTIAPRVGELGHRFFVDNLGSAERSEQAAHGDVLALREGGRWAAWMSPRWREAYPVDLRFGIPAAGFFGNRGTAKDCWYSEENPHCHKDWIVETMRWGLANVRTLHWLTVDDDSVVCMPNLLHQLRILPAPGSPAYQPYTVGRGIYPHGLYDQCFLLMSAEVAMHMAAHWWDEMRDGADTPPVVDCCMFGDTFSSHRGCAGGNVRGAKNLGFKCCQPCKLGTNHSLVSYMRRRGVDTSKWWFGAPVQRVGRKPGPGGQYQLRCSDVPGLGERWRRGEECGAHPCTGFRPPPTAPDRSYPSVCTQTVDHITSPGTWPARARVARQMLASGAALNDTVCDRLPDCALRPNCQSLEHVLRWCRDRLFLHKIKQPAEIMSIWALTHGSAEQERLPQSARHWRFKNLSTSPVFGWTRHAAEASRVVRNADGSVDVFGAAGERSWHWDGTCD